MSPRILICDELAPAALEAFRSRGFEPEIRTGLSEEELVATVPGADAVVVRSATKITRNVLEAADALRVVGRAGIGVDNIDLSAATERGVVVMNTPFGNATTTAELAITLLCALSRHVVRADKMARSGTWKKKQLVGTELTGKTLGIVGLGRIGRLVAERGLGLGLRVIAFDAFLKKGESPVPGVELRTLEELLAEVDFVSVHVPLTPATRNLISWKELAAIKPGARLIQVSRGGTVDEEAVVDALNSGRLAGAAFDVFVEEPAPADHPLVTREDVIVTPHLGASSKEAQLRVAVDIADQIADFFEHGVATNAVNAPTLPPEQQHQLAPFLTLAEKLGSFLAQRLVEPIRKVELTACGAIAGLGSEHLRLAFLVGVLRQSLATPVNSVNAPNLAKERGLFVLESEREEAGFQPGELRVRATTRGGEATCLVAGTVFGREPRITRVDDIRLDLPPRGRLLITRHKDRPGALGRIGSLLGEHDLNIRRLELGPADPDAGAAIGFLTLEGTPTDDTVEALRSLDDIEAVQFVEL